VALYVDPTIPPVSAPEVVVIPGFTGTVSLTEAVGLPVLEAVAVIVTARAVVTGVGAV
jgi:hypothetical protein